MPTEGKPDGRPKHTAEPSKEFKDRDYGDAGSAAPRRNPPLPLSAQLLPLIQRRLQQDGPMRLRLRRDHAGHHRGLNVQGKATHELFAGSTISRH